MNYHEALSSFFRHKPHTHGCMDEFVYQMIDKYAPEKGVSLETGAGLTTIFFAERSKSHQAISLFKHDFMNKLDDVAKEIDISLDNVKYTQGPSDKLLPVMGKRKYDFVLVDGGHEFPIPMIDWYYTHRNIKVGGFVMFDDVLLEAVNYTCRFLMADKHWKLMERNQKCAIFKKLSNYNSTLLGWPDQNFVSDWLKVL